MEDNTKGQELWTSIRESFLTDNSMKIGPTSTYSIQNGDMKHVLFVLSRYKFVCKMLESSLKKTILELGCGEGFFSTLLSQAAEHVLSVDGDEKAINWANENYKSTRLSFLCENFLGKLYGSFDAVVSLDVIEHIEQEKERLYLKTVVENLSNTGIAIIGTPSVTASNYASEAPRIGHINLYSQERLRDLFLRYFDNVFMFGMNDEVLHTGFAPMCHYIFALACGKKSELSF